MKNRNVVWSYECVTRRRLLCTFFLLRTRIIHSNLFTLKNHRYKTRYAISWDFTSDMSLLACGDVGGSVYLFDTTTTTSKEWIVPSHVASRTHGKFAVNVVTWHRSSKDLYSASQDGMICRFRTRLVAKKTQLCHVESFRPSLTANISRIWWKDDTCMFLAGFSSNEFRVINQTTNRVAMSVKRISYRRPWDVLYDDDENDTLDQ